MFEPSAQKLINIVNKNIAEDSDKVKSRYTLIVAASKRARQLVKDGDPRVAGGANPLTIAVSELENGTIKIDKENKD